MEELNNFQRSFHWFYFSIVDFINFYYDKDLHSYVLPSKEFYCYANHSISLILVLLQIFLHTSLFSFFFLSHSSLLFFFYSVAFLLLFFQYFFSFFSFICFFVFPLFFFLSFPFFSHSFFCFFPWPSLCLS